VFPEEEERIFITSSSPAVTSASAFASEKMIQPIFQSDAAVEHDVPLEEAQKETLWFRLADSDLANAISANISLACEDSRVLEIKSWNAGTAIANRIAITTTVTIISTSVNPLAITCIAMPQSIADGTNERPAIKFESTRDAPSQGLLFIILENGLIKWCL